MAHLICDTCERRCHPYGNISKTTQYRPIDTMELCIVVGTADSVATFTFSSDSPRGDIIFVSHKNVQILRRPRVRPQLSSDSDYVIMTTSFDGHYSIW